MGRIVDLCGEVAAAAEEGAEGLILSVDAWDRLRDTFTDDEIEDALGLVRDSLLQSELVEAADTLSARLVEVLGGFGDVGVFAQAEAGQGGLSPEILGQLARRVARLEEILEVYREGPPPDRSGFEALRRRLADHGLEEEMEEESLAEEARDGEDDDE